MIDRLGVVHGEVSPFALINDIDATVQVAVDKGLLEREGGGDELL